MESPLIEEVDQACVRGRAVKRVNRSAEIRRLLDGDPGIKPAEAIRHLAILGIEIDSNLFGVVRLAWRRQRVANDVIAVEVEGGYRVRSQSEEEARGVSEIEDIDEWLKRAKEERRQDARDLAAEERASQLRQIEEDRRIEHEEERQARERGAVNTHTIKNTRLRVSGPVGRRRPKPE